MQNKAEPKEWAELKATCKSCQRCGLCNTRNNVVFGIGNPCAEVMFIGEAPGANEDLRGEPFVGRAGKLLDSMMQMIGLNRGNVYIANSIKCRPPLNRDPSEEEKEACRPYLQKQIEMMKPKIIVCLGRISAKEFIDPDFAITRQHGVFYEKNGIQMMALYHPAALLRDPNKKPDTFVDLKTLQAKIKEICQHTELEY